MPQELQVLLNKNCQVLKFLNLDFCIFFQDFFGGVALYFFREVVCLARMVKIFQSFLPIFGDFFLALLSVFILGNEAEMNCGAVSCSFNKDRI